MSISTVHRSPSQGQLRLAARRRYACRVLAGVAAGVCAWTGTHHVLVRQADMAHPRGVGASDGVAGASKLDLARSPADRTLRGTVDFARSTIAVLGAKRSSGTCRLAQLSPDRPSAFSRFSRAHFDPATIEAILRTPPRERLPQRRAADLTFSSLAADGIADAPAAKDGDAASADVLPMTHTSGRQASVQAAPAASLGLGPLSAGAHAGTLNGAPATSVDVGYTVDGVHLDAAGTTDVTSLAEPSTLRRTFKFKTMASIPFD